MINGINTFNDNVLNDEVKSFSVFLKDENNQIHGVDNSMPMLKSCKDRAILLKLHPVLYTDSIETMSLSDKYNVILIPLGSFQLFYPRELAFQVLQNLKNHLQVGDKLILDLFIPWDALYENNEEEMTEAKTNFFTGKNDR